MVAENSPAWLPAGWTVQDEVQKNGRKVRCYINPETGQKFFSRKDFIHYAQMEKIYHDMPQPVNRCITRLSVKKHMPIVAKTSDIPEWLPNGWIMELRARKSGPKIGKTYKCFIEPATGLRFYSKPEVSRYLKTLKHSSSTSKQKNKGVSTHSASIVVVEKGEAGELPPGWIKELKIRKGSNGTRKDPYYTDPVNGYVFRSRKDVFRYLETGELGRHVTRPKQMHIKNLASSADGIPPPSAIKRQNPTHRTTKRQLFAGKQHSDACNIVLPQGEGSKERLRKRPCAENESALILAVDYFQEQHSLDNAGEKCVEIKGSPDLSNSGLQKAEDSKKKPGKRVCAENGSVSTPTDDILEEKKSLENACEKHNNRQTQNRGGKSKNYKVLTYPCRSSKRLAGLKPEMEASLGSVERRVQIEASKIEATTAVSLADHASQDLKTCSEKELALDNSKGNGASLDEELLNKNILPLENQGSPADQPGKLITENKDDNKLESQLIFPFPDSWSDPCLEFAFKTLTGAIPVDDNLAIQGYFEQQLNTSHAQNTGGLALPDFALPSFFPNDSSSQFDAFDKPITNQQLPVKPAILPPGNISLPSCSTTGSQQPASKVNKEYHRDLNY